METETASLGAATGAHDRAQPRPRYGWLLALGIMAVGALGAEALARALFAEQIVLFPRYHTDAQYGDFTLRSLTRDTTFWHQSADGRWQFTTNGQGFRDDHDYAHDKADGVYRVLNLGDSHTQGFEVRQQRTFSAVMERGLRAAGVDAEVMNTGISGFGTAEQLVFLEQEGVRYKPDAVVLAFYGNDFEDNVKSGLFALKDGELRVRKQRHAPGVRILNALNAVPPLRWLSENSYFYSFVLNTAWVTAKEWQSKKSHQAAAIEYAVPMAEVNDYRRDLTLALLQRMHSVCRTLGIPLIIVDVPRVSDSQGFKSSIPAELTAEFEAASHRYVSSGRVFAAYRDIAEVHVPHGHRHISEFAHLMIGHELVTSLLSEIITAGATTGTSAADASAAH